MKNYYLVIDTETANGLLDPLVYDTGLAICDKKGNIYFKQSYVVSDIFCKERDLMQSAYYAEKIPQYVANIRDNLSNVVTLAQLHKIIKDLCAEWKVTAICAYNAHFDCTSLNITQRYITKSKYRYFLPYGVPVFDIWNMACQVLCKRKSYARFCINNGFFSEKGNMLTNAQTVFAYIKNDPHFAEKHMGLDDVLIEAQIMAYCFRQHKTMNKGINRLCWKIPQNVAKEV